MPYLDIWDNKPPGIFALMSVLMPAPASDTLWLALTESLFVAVTALLIYALLRRLGLAETWRIAGVGFFVLLNTLAIYADGGGYTELFTLAPSVASVLLWLRGKSEEKAAWLVLAGASTGLGTLFKLPAIAPLLAFLTFSALECITRSKPIGLCLRQSTQLLTGFALPWSITGAYFMYHGAAAELLRVSFLHPFAYGYSSLSTRLGLAGVARRLYYVLWPLAPLIPPVVIGVPWSILCRRRRLAGASLLDTKRPDAPGPLIVILLWVAVDLAGAFAGGRFYGHYFTACTASGCVALAVSLDAHFRETTARIGILCSLVVPLLLNSIVDLAGSFARREEPSDPAAAQLRIAQFLRANADPSDTLFVWEYAPLIYQSSGMRNAFPWTTSVNLFDSPARGAKLFREITDRWSNAPPSLVISSTSSSDHTQKVGDSALDRSPAMRQYERQLLTILTDRYDSIYSEARYTVHRLRKAPRASPSPPTATPPAPSSPP